MFNTHTKCLLCNSNNLIALKNYQKNYLVKCSDCGFSFCVRIPSEEELLNHYKKYNRGGSISPITLKRYIDLLSGFEKYRKTNNLLDIGCGDGYFLALAKTRGWNVYGTEYTDEAVSLCQTKSIHIHKGKLDPNNYKDLFFDVITSFEVIEHINNPQEEIENIKKVLRSKGLFYFTTPNFNSVSRFYLKEKWNVIEYPEHLSYYTSGTINKFLTISGFKKIRLITTGININRFKNSLDETDTASVINTEEQLRQKSEHLFLYKAAKISINAILNLFKAGDSIKAFYQKK